MRMLRIKLADQGEFRRRVADVIAAIEADADRFDMLEMFHHACDTPRCIAGHTFVLAVKDDGFEIEIVNGETDYGIAKRYLGLDRHAADRLFQPTGDDAYYAAEAGDDGFVTVEHAVAVLRNLADNLEIDWSVRP